jgi:two-component system response regulator DegU
MNILIADDNDKIRLFIKQILLESIKGINNIYECRNGKEAIETYNEYKPDWILLDVKMNSIDGLSAAEKIKERDPNAKIIIVTNYDDLSYRKKAGSINVFAYILKENLDELVKILQKDL